MTILLTVTNGNHLNKKYSILMGRNRIHVYAMSIEIVSD